MKIRTIMQGCW